MPEWVNKGSTRDLSGLAAKSLAVSSMAAGNMMSSNRHAMTAPGSEPVDPLPPSKDQGDPQIGIGSPVPAATDGKPQASGQASYTPAAARWVPTTVPEVVREQWPNGPGAELPD